MSSFYLLILSLVLSSVLTGVFRKYALKNNLLDVPNERSSHVEPTPRGGGVVIVGVFLMISWVMFFLGHFSSSSVIALSIGGLLVAGVGLLDDNRHVPAHWRLFVHFLAFGVALCLVGNLCPNFLVGKKWYFCFAINLFALFALVWLLNLFNFMDGIDGIAASEAVSVLLCASAIIFIKYGMSAEFFLCLLLAATCLGFLCWNWPSAKIFMGDAGSGFLGYSIGVLCLLTIAPRIISFWAWSILLGVFLVDSTTTLVRRSLRGEKVYQAHCSHAYQNAARIYSSHMKVTVGVLLINIFWLFPLAILATVCPALGWLFAIIALTPLFVLAIKLGAGIRTFRG